MPKRFAGKVCVVSGEGQESGRKQPFLLQGKEQRSLQLTSMKKASSRESLP
ncbi:hypothetical protein [Bacillus sp. ISL-75]|uniref:hypothetical protein n=1 Tax=Bacillus sp. ISL-75 TaxID=2819137 RepID=UPI0020358F17|nr:hypothetical protein [Bacillus sp. ISL-75]